MYIGPWQEYKLAQVLNFKQNLPSRQPKLNQDILQKHNKSYSRQASASPSDRSIYSEPLKEIETLYRTCRRVEGLLAKSEIGENRGLRKPPIPIQRQRKAQSLQVRRIQKMKEMYGLKGRPNETASEIQTSEAQTSETAPPQTHLPVIERRPPIPRSPPMPTKDLSTSLPAIGSPKANYEQQDSILKDQLTNQRVPVQTVETKISASNEKATPPTSSKETNVVLPPIGSPQKLSKTTNLERFTSLQSSGSPDLVPEEEFDKQADGLLKWIEELPDELSSSSVFQSKVVL
mmetsp:Transcript_24497/g.43375  ORF Transcript_24497/g.43375 Transcript_24497/m.43375 type:complete len:289 (-) Transcript_24497:102-968(-)